MVPVKLSWLAVRFSGSPAYQSAQARSRTISSHRVTSQAVVFSEAGRKTASAQLRAILLSINIFNNSPDYARALNCNENLFNSYTTS
jgi:hypothetical protein